MPEPVGFIGLGQMGSVMAANLLSAGFPLRVYNRTAAKAQPLVERGAISVKDPANVTAKGGIVLSILADGKALESVADERLVRAIGPGGVHVSMSTVLPETSDRLADLHSRHGAAFIAAPVFGRPEAAAARKLWIALSGPRAPKPRLRPIFDALAQGVFDFGETAGAANVVKLSANFLVYSAVEAMAQAGAFAEKNGVSRGGVLNMLTQTLFNSYVYKIMAERIVSCSFSEPGFTVALALKDMNLARDVASGSHTPMPTLDLLCARYLHALEQGRADWDASALALGAAEAAGLRWSPNPPLQSERLPGGGG